MDYSSVDFSGLLYNEWIKPAAACVRLNHLDSLEKACILHHHTLVKVLFSLFSSYTSVAVSLLKSLVFPFSRYFLGRNAVNRCFLMGSM